MNNFEFGKVAVLMGGTSAERDVSLLSGEAVFKALHKRKIDAHKIDAVDGYVQELVNGNYSRVFIALHGRGGEDGVIQGFLDTLGVAYTGSGVLGSALAMNKIQSKKIWQSLGLATLPCVVWDKNNNIPRSSELIKYPMAVKPVGEGSSIGVTRVDIDKDFVAACNKAAEYGQVMIEPWIDGEEFTVGILGQRALPSVRIIAKDVFYDYSAKYLAGDTQYICPSNLPADLEQKVQNLALQAFNSISASGWGRVDFIRDKKGDFWILEVNTIPGLTNNSLVPIAAKAIGLEFDELIIEILAQTLLKARKGKKQSVFHNV